MRREPGLRGPYQKASPGRDHLACGDSTACRGPWGVNTKLIFVSPSRTTRTDLTMYNDSGKIEDDSLFLQLSEAGTSDGWAVSTSEASCLHSP